MERHATLARVCPSRGTRQHAIRIPDELWAAAIAKAKRRGDVVADVIRSALERYVEQDEPTEDDT